MKFIFLLLLVSNLWADAPVPQTIGDPARIVLSSVEYSHINQAVKYPSPLVKQLILQNYRFKDYNDFLTSPVHIKIVVIQAVVKQLRVNGPGFCRSNFRYAMPPKIWEALFLYKK
jgi:hypothetical protein